MQGWSDVCPREPDYNVFVCVLAKNIQSFSVYLSVAVVK